MTLFTGPTPFRAGVRGPSPAEAAQACSGLAAAHGAGLGHRDLKPANVMIRRYGVVRILDYGPVKLMPDDGPRTAGSTSTASAQLDRARTHTQTADCDKARFGQRHPHVSTEELAVEAGQSRRSLRHRYRQ
ncbi:hypothetical protein [Streptomyces sp. NPDC058603]|uniref:protein kinase domain-containing protein n=1 Tax=Streptomyces sp. NPDC058603 TaxID=3346551 RepID=UPI00365106D9